MCKELSAQSPLSSLATPLCLAIERRQRAAFRHGVAATMNFIHGTVIILPNYGDSMVMTSLSAVLGMAAGQRNVFLADAKISKDGSLRIGAHASIEKC